MAITSSAKKAIRASKNKRTFNLAQKKNIDKQFKTFNHCISKKDKSGAEKVIPTLYKSLDKAAKSGFIKKNTSARLKSRAMKAIAKLR